VGRDFTQAQSGFALFAPVKIYFLPALFLIAVIYLVWHHYTEIKKPGYEFSFLRQLNRFMRDRDTNRSEETLIPAALQVFHRVFANSHIERCSIYTLSDGGLVIPENYVYPRTAEQSYKINLKVGEGVAGLVCMDALPRYVPRLFFPFATWRKFLPSIPFPHAVKFEPRLNGEILELVNEDLDFYAFKNPNKAVPRFQSFISVPLKPVGVGECFGVLNFDFSKVDALDKSGIAMASVLGLLLADEVNRLRSMKSSGKTVEMKNDLDSETPVIDTEDASEPVRIVRLGGISGRDKGGVGHALEAKETSSAPRQGLSRHLTWSKVKAGWAEFKDKGESSE
jgi:hypothetical protein